MHSDLFAGIGEQEMATGPRCCRATNAPRHVNKHENSVWKVITEDLALEHHR